MESVKFSANFRSAAVLKKLVDGALSLVAAVNTVEADHLRSSGVKELATEGHIECNSDGVKFSVPNWLAR